MSKNIWSTEEKYSIVLESLKGNETIQKICNKYGITQTTFYKWRDKFLEGAKHNLTSNSQRDASDPDKARIEELEKLVGKKSLEIEILKKTLKLI